MTKSEDRVLTAVRIDKETIKGLEKLAEKMDRSMSWLIRAACDAYVAKGGKV